MDGERNEEAAAQRPAGNEVEPEGHPRRYRGVRAEVYRMWQGEREGNPHIEPFDIWAEKKFIQGKEGAGNEQGSADDGKPFVEEYRVGAIRRLIDTERRERERPEREARRERRWQETSERWHRREERDREKFEKERERAATQWLKSLPEFHGSDEARIREVVEQLIQLEKHQTVVPGQDIGRPAPETPRRDAEGLGR
jgi:hypothetical protein